MESGDPIDTEIRRAIGDERYRDAIGSCARHYGNAIGRVCMAMVASQGEAEELAQETLLAAYRGIEAYRSEGAVRAWLLGIARKKCLKHLERTRRQANKLMLLEGGREAGSAEDLLEQRRRAERARDALDQVRPTEREALVLRYQGELSFVDVAQACDVDPAAARKRVSRGLARLRSVLIQQEKS